MAKDSIVSNKKIVVITSHTPSLICFRLDMLKAFIETGYTVIAVGDEGEEEWVPKFREYDIEYYSAPMVRNGLNPFEDLVTFRALYKLLKEIRPDKVFLNQAKAVVYGGIATRMLKMETYSLVSGIGTGFRDESLKFKIIRQIMKFQYKLALAQNESVIFHNKDDKDIFVKWKLVKTERCSVVYGSGVNMEQFSYTPIKTPEKTVFLLVARILRCKGVEEYLEACKKIKEDFANVECMLVGPFDTNPSALSEADLEPYRQYVDYYGEQADVRPFLKKCTVFILPSYYEGLPKSVLEAMSVGRAIITTDAPGNRDVVEDGENGFLVPIKDVDQLYKKMRYMVEHPEIQSEMGKKSRYYVEEKFDVNKVNAEIIKIMKLN